MGVEIYPFVEVDWGEGEPFADEGYVRGFNLGEFFIWRANLPMFYALGLGTCPRCLRYMPRDELEPVPVFPLRGLPPNIGAGVLGRYFHVVDAYGYENDLDPVLPTVTPPRANRWLEDGLSVEGPPLPIIRSGIRDNKPLRRVSNPNWHCTSWLTLAEFREALDHQMLLPNLRADAHALLAAMQALEDRLGTGRTRVVYWFDNVPG